MSLKKLALTATALVALGALLPLAPVSAADITVAVTAIVEHPALDACRDGIKDELKAQGFEDGKNITFVYESAQGNPGTAAQIAQKFVGENPTVIVPISTPSAQAVVAATSDIPVVFTAVTDPLGAKLITNLEKPGANVTGMSDLSPIAKHLALIKEVTPNAKKLAVLIFGNPSLAATYDLGIIDRQRLRPPPDALHERLIGGMRQRFDRCGIGGVGTAESEGNRAHSHNLKPLF